MTREEYMWKHGRYFCGDYEDLKNCRSVQKKTGARLINYAVGLRNGQRVRLELYSLPIDDGDHRRAFIKIDDNDRKEKFFLFQSSTYDAYSTKSATRSFLRACDELGTKPACKVTWW